MINRLNHCAGHTDTNTLRDDEPSQHLFNRNIERHHIHVQRMRVITTKTSTKTETHIWTPTMGNMKNLAQYLLKKKKWSTDRCYNIHEP